MRRELARELRNHANHMYTVDQEAATADEKETDIRLRATRSPQQATIELKIGEKPRSAADLRKALKDQLLKKYMAADDCRAGCLVVTVRSGKTWTHPKNRKRLDLSGLIAMLNEEANRLAAKLGGSIRLMAKGLDLRPRLQTERATTGKQGKPKPKKSAAKKQGASKKKAATKKAATRRPTPQKKSDSDPGVRNRDLKDPDEPFRAVYWCITRPSAYGSRCRPLRNGVRARELLSHSIDHGNFLWLEQGASTHLGRLNGLAQHVARYAGPAKLFWLNAISIQND